MRLILALPTLPELGDAEEQEESARREELRIKILSCCRGNQRRTFEQFVNEGFLLIEDEQPVFRRGE